MATNHTESAAAKQWGRASIVNSFLLPVTAALHLDVMFWVLVLTNFVLMHAIWVSQLFRVNSWKRIDWAPAKWPLIAFAVLGNLTVLLWEERLLAVFPS